MRKAKLYMAGDFVMTIKEAAELIGMKEDTLRKRLKRGSTLEKELNMVKVDVKKSHLTDE